MGSGDDVQSDWLDGARLKVVPNGSRTMKHRNITNDTEAGAVQDRFAPQPWNHLRLQVCS